MSTPITPIARLGRLARLGRRGWAIAVPLLAAGALAAGCGTTQAAPGASATGRTTAASPGASASATPVPTVTGGRVAAGEPACVGWPSGVPSGTLPVSFVPVSVERCVNGVQAVPGKGQWVSATLERADSGLATLISALRQPTAAHLPSMICPALVMLPPQLVLINQSGQKLIPRLPRTGCGTVEARVFVVLAALHWNPVSVRLVAEVPAAAPTPTVVGSAPAAPVTNQPQSGAVQP